MKEKTYSTDIANAINTFLEEDDWHFSFNEQRGVFKFGLCLKGKMKKLNYVIYVRENRYFVYATAPLGADEDDEKMMTAMAEFVCRANYGIKNGNFEFDMRDGEIRYKCYVDCEDLIPSAAVVRNSIYCPAAMFDQYSDGIIGIIFGNMTAKDAVDKCENSPVEELRTLLGDDIDADADVDTMLARLAEKLGIDTGGESSTGVLHENSDDTITVNTDLFGSKGGSN